MKNWRDIFPFVACAWLIWFLISRANEGIVSEVYWIDLLYNVGLMAVGVVFVIGLVILLQHLLNLSTPFFIGAFILLIVAFAIIEHFWLRGLVAQLLRAAS